eukprot:526140-Alexandrium_andersonii.AAC.1
MNLQPELECLGRGVLRQGQPQTSLILEGGKKDVGAEDVRACNWAACACTFSPTARAPAACAWRGPLSR